MLSYAATHAHGCSADATLKGNAHAYFKQPILCLPASPAAALGPQAPTTFSLTSLGLQGSYAENA